MLNVYLVDRITIKQKKFDKWGEPSTERTINVRARFDYSVRNVFNDKGQRAVSSAIITMKNRDINLKDIIVFDDREYTIINISRDKDFTLNKILKVAVA